VGTRSRSRRTEASRPDGRHLLRSASVAAELVRDAGVAEHELVLEIGAGDGRLTRELARRARHVVAVELDPVDVDRLRARFAGDPAVTIAHGDVREVPLPREPFRAFGNIPFGVTNAVLRRLLDDPLGSTTGADLIVQFEAARKRTEPWPSTALGLGWLPWWELMIARRIPRTGFDPPPSVDAAVLRAVRRPEPLLDPRRRSRYVTTVRAAFAQPTWPVPRVLRGALPPMKWKRFARERGLRPDATARHLDVWDWVALVEVLDPLAAITPRRGAPRRSRQRSAGTTPRRS